METAAVAHLGVTDSRGRCAAGVAVEEGDLRGTAVNHPGGTGTQASMASPGSHRLTPDRLRLSPPRLSPTHFFTVAIC